jgi:hypothetical protein
MGIDKPEDKRRELDPVTEVALPSGPVPLLQKYESVIGIPLRKLKASEVKPLEQTGTPWEWSWTPDQVAMFLGDWDSQVYMASPLLKDMALTPDPMGGGFVFERFCRPDIINAIRKIQIMYTKPLGQLRPVPKGTYSIDLRKHPPGVRQKVFRINDWEFWGFVQNVPEGIRTTLAYMHSRWMAREMRVMDGADHVDDDLGAVNAPARRA